MAKTADSKSKLQETLERLEKEYGKGTILTLDSKVNGDYEVISTGSIGFDYVTLGVGGFVKGRIYEVIGWEGCLAEDTYLKFITVRPDGIVQDCKGGSIKNLYKRFHNRTDKTLETDFYVVSVNEEDRIFRNPIADVVKSGKKECFEITTISGFKLRATKDHKFYTGEKYVPLQDLSVGDTVFVHNNTPYRSNDPPIRRKYAETTIKYYYRGKIKFVNGYPYFRENVHRLIYEAAQNGMTYEEYKDYLNTHDKLPADFWTIPDGFDIHHVDEDCTNNDLSNLVMYDGSAHSQLHALARQDNLRFIAVPDTIESIISVGEMETYDIKCYHPYNNFVASGFVVHNSGKSTICGHAVASCQKNGGRVLYIDGEHAVDKNYFRALGVDTTSLLMSQPNTGEEGFNIAIEMAKSGEVDMIVIDSDSSLIPKVVIDGEVGESAIGKKARLNSDAYPKLKNAVVQNNVCCLVVSQYREKIGVMFGSPNVTQGGHALKFYSDCRIEVNRSTLVKDGETSVGNTTKIKCIKNKMSPPYRNCQFEIVFGKGIDKDKEIIDLGVDLGIINKSGSWYSYGESKIGQGLEAVISTFNDNPELYEECRNKIISKLKGESIINEEPESVDFNGKKI